MLQAQSRLSKRVRSVIPSVLLHPPSARCALPFVFLFFFFVVFDVQNMGVVPSVLCCEQVTTAVTTAGVAERYV